MRKILATLMSLVAFPAVAASVDCDTSVGAVIANGGQPNVTVCCGTLAPIPGMRLVFEQMKPGCVLVYFSGTAKDDLTLFQAVIDRGVVGKAVTADGERGSGGGRDAFGAIFMFSNIAKGRHILEVGMTTGVNRTITVESPAMVVHYNRKK